MKKHIDIPSIEKFRNGDQKAFRFIFDTLYALMLSFAMKYLADKQEAEDMVQEAFIELWNQKTKFLNADQMRSFLYITLRNRCLNRIRQIQIREDYARSKTGEKWNEPDFEEEVIRAEFLAKLKMVIDTFPVQRKKIILMSMHGSKNHEIAEDMNISVNSVRLQKKIAYRDLRKRLSSSLPVLIVLASFFS